MPKNHSDWPINMTLRVSVVQRDYLADMAEMHGVTPGEYLRALIDAEAKRLIGTPGADDATALLRAGGIVREAAHG